MLHNGSYVIEAAEGENEHMDFWAVNFYSLKNKKFTTFMVALNVSDTPEAVWDWHEK